MLLAYYQNDRCKDEQASWKEIGKPKANVFLSVHHGNLANEGANIDAHVEIEEESRYCDRGIDYDTLARCQSLDSFLGVGLLFS